MAEYLLVDGYNVVYAWDELKKLVDKDLNHARLRLIDLLAEYGAYKGLQVYVVFDAHLVKGGQGFSETVNGTEVIYTTEGETADSFIERFTASVAPGDRVLVATSDWNQQRIVFGKGAVRVSSRELQRELMLFKQEVRERGAGPKDYDTTLRQHLKDNILEVLEKIRRQK